MKQVSPAEIRAVNPTVHSVEEETGLFRWYQIYVAKRIDQEYDFHLLPIHDINTNKMFVVYINWDSHFRWPLILLVALFFHLSF